MGSSGYRCFHGAAWSRPSGSRIAAFRFHGKVNDVAAQHLGAIRVMRTLGMLGEVVAMAADLCRRHGCQPRDVYRTHLVELKAAMQTGIHIAQDHAYLPNDHDLYHFMRPVGSVGNDDENIWLRVGPDGHTLEPPPHETIRRAVARLGHHMVSDGRTH